MRGTIAIACFVAALTLDHPARAQPADPARASYDAAFDALAAGRIDDAIRGFDEVAAAAADDELRSAARELARFARRLRAEGKQIGAISVDGGPMRSSVSIPEEDQFGAGRTEFVVNTTLASLYAGAVLIPIADVDSVEGGSAIILGATAAGFLGSFFLSDGRDVSEGMAAAYRNGLLFGAANGLLLSSPLGADDAQAVLGVSLGATAVGGGVALALGDWARPTVAHSDLTGTLAIMGMGSVGLGFALVQPDDPDEDTVLVLLAAGLDAGLIAGTVVGARVDWSTARARLVFLSSVLGAVAGFGGAGISLGEPEGDSEVRAFAGIGLAGMWSGFGLGVYLTRNMEPGARFRMLTSTPIVTPTLIGGAPGLAITFF